MSGLYSSFAQKLLFKLDAERAHGLSIKALQMGLHPRFNNGTDTRLAMNVAGLSFPNPLGMAAGYDKGADVPDALLAMGFGHTEIGTVTPKPQAGNPTPRIFRLVEDGAVINRLGFNSTGHTVARQKLLERGNRLGIIGVNIGANKTSEDFATDYVTGIENFADLATYFTINISSPNTPGLRALQGADPLASLLAQVSEAREKHTIRTIPLFLKIAPDLDENELDAITKALNNSNFDGLIVSNTTLSRAGLDSTNRTEVGGLSGRPLFERSTIVLAKMRQRMGNEFPLVGVGGVSNGDDAFTKIEAGASLVQLYTGLIYGGPTLPREILHSLSARLDKEKITSLKDVIGRDTKNWAARELPTS
ncbi:MAG: quinone-dependent dihydroorotate dehydrogenase [Rhizobiaceae bacterium]